MEVTGRSYRHTTTGVGRALKTTNLLLLAGAAYLGSKLMPKEVKEDLPFGGGTSINITESPIDWSTLTDALGKITGEMPFPETPSWLLSPPDWLDKVKDVTAIPEMIFNEPDWLKKAKEWWDTAQAAVNPDTAGVLPDLSGLLDKFLDTVTTVVETVTPAVVPNKAGTSPEIGGGKWWKHLTGGWQDVYDFINPFDIAKHFYATDAWEADKLLTAYARNVQPRPEQSYVAPTGVITEASPVRQRPVFSGGSTVFSYKKIGSGTEIPYSEGFKVWGTKNNIPVVSKRDPSTYSPAEWLS